MSLDLNKLESLLKNEIILGEKFIALLEEKRISIIKNNTDRMQELTQEENQTIEEIEEIGYSRQDLVLDISKQEKLRITQNLGDFIAQLPQDFVEKFNELRSTLLKNFEKIATISKLNAELLKQNLDFTNHMYNRITASDKRVRNGNYSRFNSTQGKQGGGASLTFNHKG